MKAKGKGRDKRKISKDGMNRLKDLEFLLAKVLYVSKKNSSKKPAKG